jgi:hypothetical protein
MAKYNIYGHVLYSEIEYEKLMYMTEKIFIQSLMNGIPSITEWVENIWNNIDHEYMIVTLEEIKKDIITQDLRTYFKYKNTTIDLDEILKTTNKIPDLFKINKIENFKYIEKKFGERIAKVYKTRVETIEEVDELEYLTQQVKDFHKLEQTIVYKNGMRVTPSTYLSLLYNVNLTRTGWNQTFKDADYFEKDLMILETHPRSCPLCAPMQRKSIFKNRQIEISER